MPKINSKIRLPRATKDSNRFNLDCRNITTMDFFKLKPVYTRELVPNSTLKLNMGVFSRLSPLAKPVYGDCKIISRGFFVPFRTVMDGWNEFITDTTYKSVVPEVPVIQMADLLDVFSASKYVVTANSRTEMESLFFNENYLAIKLNWTYSDSHPYADFTSWEDGTMVDDFKFTQLGKHVYDILCSLGYGLNFVDRTTAESFEMSLLPLLSYYKLFQDWYRNAAYDYVWPIEFPLAADYWNSLTYIQKRDVLFEALKSFRFAFYERDYFTSAFDNPQGPNQLSAMQEDIVLNDSSLLAQGSSISADTLPRVVTEPESGTPILAPRTGSYNPITKYIIQGLNLLTDYFKRHQLSGTQAMERFLARFGIQLPDAKLNRSVYLGKSITPIQIADVMNQTAPQSDDARYALGEYAGRGIGSGQGSFDYHSDEYGQFFVVSVVVPDVMYVQGIDRALLHINRLDFYTPEFDGLGVQAISRAEIIGKNLGILTDETSSGRGMQLDKVFGFTSRYAEYKVAQDRVSGDFLLKLEDETSDMNRLHFARVLNPNEQLVHSLDFTRANPTQYNRVFADSNSDYDHFINVFYFNVSLQQPMRRMFDDYDFEDVDSGKDVSVHLGGVTKD